MNQPIPDFYLGQPEPNGSCLQALRQVILQQHPGIAETVKYGMPCFCIGKKVFCYLWTDKISAEPYVLFVDGKQLHHPALESGNRKKMKLLRVDPRQDLPVQILVPLLQQAISLHQTKV